ncbi:MAG TPA: hypothetical protein VGP93_18185, partial [Polyangiaceae bacterium]|nr:hypothetical protein [Polyangiaceae bacterium]
MYVWRTAYDAKGEVRQHTLAEGGGHALLAALATQAFTTLRISASVWEHGPEWWAIHYEPSVLMFDAEHGRDRERTAYNARKCAEAGRRRTAIRGQFHGYSDLFVPLMLKQRVVAFLIAGPFVTARLSAKNILERWQLLTGRQGHSSDPEFAAYLSTALSTLVLDGPKLAAFEELVASLAQLMGGAGRADTLMNRIEHLSRELDQIRFAEQAWDLVRTMLDDRAPRGAYAPSAANQRRLLGLSRIADHVLVGLTRSRRSEPDPVDEAVRRDALQRACVELARATGDVLCGQVGDHGVVFLCGSSGSSDKKRRKLNSLAGRAGALAQSFGFSLHCGVSPASRAIPPSRSYQAALAAAESALSRDEKMLAAESGNAFSLHPLRGLRKELARAVLESP